MRSSRVSRAFVVALTLVLTASTVAAAAAPGGEVSQYMNVTKSTPVPNTGYRENDRYMFIENACPPGSKAFSGGMKTERGDGGVVMQSYPRDDGSAWVVQWGEEGAPDRSVETYVVCSSLGAEPDSGYQVVSNATSVGPTSAQVVGASCPDYPATVVGGGVVSSRDRTTVVTQSYPSDDGHGWIAGQWNGEMFLSLQAVAKAVCAFIPTEVYADILSGYEIVAVQRDVKARTANPLVGNPEKIEVRCPSGKRALAGGVLADRNGMASINQSYPARGGASWVVEWRNNMSDMRRVVAKAICAVVP